jgi:hypothetical protein
MRTVRRCLLCAALFLLSASLCLHAADLLVETEAFADRGGWSLDTQFTDTMGSPCLLAHGLGTPVADAATTVTLPGGADGMPATYRVWARTRNWTPGFEGENAPGRFQVLVDGTPLPPVFGETGDAWHWQDGGTVSLPAGHATLALHDLTGFEGRCDALWLTTDIAAPPPPGAGAELAQWRAQMRGEAAPPAPPEAFDLVVVGGGFGGCCAALAAARSGLRVAFVQDRPVLGGNASQEIRVASRGERRYRIVDEIDTFDLSNRSATTVARDAARLAVVQAEPGITLYMPWRAYAAGTNAARRITHVDIRHADSTQRLRLTAPLFVDATGDGWIGYWAGADWRMGREARADHTESLAPTTADLQTMGNSLMWTSKLNAEPADFPADLPWAAAVAGAAAETGGEWDGEYGINAALDTVWDAEHIRDHLLRAIYGNFANAKRNPGNANRALDWVPYVAGKRESRRILGPYILSQSDVLVGRYFEDAVATTDWGIDLHRETSVSYRSTYTNHGKVSPCYIPYRCLFSRNVPNLFLAGRHISVTHVGLGSPRVMNTIGQLGVAVGYAAALCREQACEPADIYRFAEKFAALRARLDANTIGTPAWPANPWLSSASIVDNLDTARVRIYGDWTPSNADSERWQSNYLHDGNAGKGEKFVVFKPDTPLTGDYTVATFHSNGGNRATNAPVWVITNDLRTAADALPAYARSDSADMFMDNTEALVGRVGSGKYFRAFLRFDLSSLPPGALLDTATLTLAIRIPDASSVNETAGARGLTVHGLTESFAPSSITWNSRASGTAWTTPGGTFNPDAAVTAITSPPYFLDVTDGQTFVFPATTNLFALVQSIQTNNAADKSLYLVVRTPDLETNYASRKIYRFAGARLDVTYADPSVPPTMRINLQQQQAQWRDIGVFPVGAAGLRVMLGTEGTTNYVTADAVRVDIQRSDTDPEDYDGNGLPNIWERRWFMQETGTDPLADPDGDGKTNLEEFEHNTNPLDAHSRPEFGTRMTFSDNSH